MINHWRGGLFLLTLPLPQENISRQNPFFIIWSSFIATNVTDTGINV